MPVLFGFCHHEWVLERGARGQLLRRCLHCLRVRPDPMTALVRSNPPYQPVEPVRQPDFPPPLGALHPVKR